MRTVFLLTLTAALAACTTLSTPDQARRPGEPTFRAVGNEPGWVVTVYPDSLVYLTNYGEDRYVFTHFATRPSGGGIFQTLAPDPGFTLTITDGPCFDDMSGEPFEKAARVVFEEWTYRGCGTRLLERRD